MMINGKITVFLLMILIISAPAFSKNKKDFIVNGNFSAGNTGFFTNYKYSPGNMKPATCYSITRNAKSDYFKFDSCKDHTSGDGYYMLVNGSDSADRVVWSQTIRGLDHHQTYELTIWLMSIDTLNPAILEITINGEKLRYSPLYIPKEKCQWNKYTLYWNCYEVDTAKIDIIDISFRYYGNDFGLDDISFKSECEVYADAGEDRTICKLSRTILGDSAGGNMPPLKYAWVPSGKLSAFNILHPEAFPDVTTTYYLTVEDNLGCIDFDTVIVYVTDPPPVGIKTDVKPEICPCDSIKLYAPNAVNYKWSTGDTSQIIYANQPAEYSVTAFNGLGCWSESKITISIYDFDVKFNLGNITAQTGEVIRLPWQIASNIDKKICKDYFFNGKLIYNGTILTSLDSKYSRNRVDDIESLELVNVHPDSLKNLKFFTSLGNSDSTNIQFMDESMDCRLIATSVGNGTVYISDICKDGGSRYFIDNRSASAIRSIYPNPSEYEINVLIETGEAGEFHLSIINHLGEKVKNISEVISRPGKYERNFDIQDLSAGFYYLKLQSTHAVNYKSFSIIR